MLHAACRLLASKQCLLHAAWLSAPAGELTPQAAVPHAHGTKHNNNGAAPLYCVQPHCKHLYSEEEGPPYAAVASTGSANLTGEQNQWFSLFRLSSVSFLPVAASSHSTCMWPLWQQEHSSSARGPEPGSKSSWLHALQAWSTGVAQSAAAAAAAAARSAAAMAASAGLLADLQAVCSSCREFRL